MTSPLSTLCDLKPKLRRNKTLHRKTVHYPILLIYAESEFVNNLSYTIPGEESNCELFMEPGFSLVYNCRTAIT